MTQATQASETGGAETVREPRGPTALITEAPDAVCMLLLTLSVNNRRALLAAAKRLESSAERFERDYPGPAAVVRRDAATATRELLAWCNAVQAEACAASRPLTPEAPR